MGEFMTNLGTIIVVCAFWGFILRAVLFFAGVW